MLIDKIDPYSNVSKASCIANHKVISLTIIMTANNHHNFSDCSIRNIDLVILLKLKSHNVCALNDSYSNPGHIIWVTSLRLDVCVNKIGIIIKSS